MRENLYVQYALNIARGIYHTCFQKRNMSVILPLICLTISGTKAFAIPTHNIINSDTEQK